MKKGLTWTLAVLLVLAAGTAAVGWRSYDTFLQTPLDLPAEGLVFELSPGTTGNELVRQLGALGITRAGWQWRLLMRLEPGVYRAGEYRLQSGLLPPDLLGLLSGGQVIQHRFTLVEGWNFRQLAAALARDPVLVHDLDFDFPGQRAQVESLFGLEHPEGWFLPETYLFVRGDSDRDILQRAYAAMRRELEQAWMARADDLPLSSPYELLILASIVEKETALDSERARIAGVFVRRLRKGMRLQTDPTVIYGLGETFDGDIRSRDLKTDTPYNTYTRHGLPPTPIAMPGRESLRAAARPEEGEALYFVADGEGGHTFSRTLEEHREAVRKLLERG